jgi:hypothetical protein
MPKSPKNISLTTTKHQQSKNKVGHLHIYRKRSEENDKIVSRYKRKNSIPHMKNNRNI